MSTAIRRTPRSYTLLHIQSDFLRSKGQIDWALKLAKEAVNCAPSEFVTWEKLTELYIDGKDYESVIFSCFCFLCRRSASMPGFAYAEFMSNVHVQREGYSPCYSNLARTYSM